MTTIKPITTKKELEIFWKLRNFLRIHSFARPAMDNTHTRGHKRGRDDQESDDQEGDDQDVQDVQEGDEPPPSKTQRVAQSVNDNHDAQFQEQLIKYRYIRMLTWMIDALRSNTLNDNLIE